MAQTTDELAKQLQALSDIEEIKQLKARYINICDGEWGGRKSHDPDRIVSLFTEDCEWDGGVYGMRKGRAALRDYYVKEVSNNRPAAFHLLTSPIIEVRGDRAIGSWHLTIILTMADQSCALVGGVFADEYARTAEGWRIKRSNFTLAVTGKYEGAWTFLNGASG